MKRTGLFALAAMLVAWCAAPHTCGQEVRLRLATTTSTQDSGLLDVLLPPFEKRFSVKVDVVAVGTGKAIKIGENGDADVVLVHARELEDKFVAEGHGVNRRDVMHNDFLLLGPSDDPAKIKGEKDAVAAFKRLAEAQVPFVSRADLSGTHAKEKSLWAAAGVKPAGAWYLEAGQGMGPTLIMSDEKNAYVLCDRGTYAAFKEKIRLVPVSEGDPRFHNSYGIIAVNPAEHPNVKYMEAMALIAWVTSREGQEIIGKFSRNGTLLFVPNAAPQAIK